MAPHRDWVGRCPAIGCGVDPCYRPTADRRQISRRIHFLLCGAAFRRVGPCASQLEQQVGNASFWRQTLLAAAIVVLILFRYSVRR